MVREGLPGAGRLRRRGRRRGGIGGLTALRSSAHPDWMGGGAAGRSSTGLCRVGFALRELARKLLWSELSDARGGICVCVYRTEGKTAAWMDETHLCKEFSILLYNEAPSHDTGHGTGAHSLTLEKEFCTR